ncbi:equilibrative nucleoside transporter 4-like [Amphiura filiformis]|uniref:equilibrative nucleoside transporter 4-like n=1 Tax=Amphiura filiformis TaxID=82378 RepID=UPI003B211F4B
MEEVCLNSPTQENIPYASLKNGTDLDLNPQPTARSRGPTPRDDSPSSSSPHSRILVEQPKDQYNIIYICLLLAGIGFLLPYNSFITAVDYFLAKYGQGSTIVFDMSLTYIVVGFVAVILNNALVESFSLHVRITFGYVVSFVSLLLVAIFEVGLESFSEHTSYVVILLAVATVSLGCTVQQSSFYGYAGMLPRRFTQAVMTGESAAGLITSINRIVTKLVLHNEKANTLIFFVLSAVIVLLCLLTHHLARRSDFIRYYTAACNAAAAGDDQQHLTLNDQFSQYDGIHHDKPEDDDQMEKQAQPSPTIKFEIEYPVQKTYIRWMTRVRSIKRGLAARRDVAKLIWPYMLSIGIAYFVTLCLFPGIESDVLSCALGGWMPVILMAIFNATDFCGKILGAVPFDWPPRSLVIAQCSRVILIPLLLLCVVPRSDPIFNHDVWPMVISAGLGLSNGYFGSVPMILAPGKIPEEKRELAGNIMTLSYNVGLTTGSAVAYLLNYLIGKPSITCLKTDG